MKIVCVLASYQHVLVFFSSIVTEGFGTFFFFKNTQKQLKPQVKVKEKSVLKSLSTVSLFLKSKKSTI